MNSLSIKMTLLSIATLVIISSVQTLVCVEFPKAELSASEALFKNLSNKDLVLKYKQEFATLKNLFKNTTVQQANPALSQLPIFRIAVFKALVAEIKKREKKLLSPQELQNANKFIQQEEAKMKAGIEAENRSLLK